MLSRQHVDLGKNGRTKVGDAPGHVGHVTQFLVGC
jgi:hypothetical protein